ncbi:MAG: 50S ribosomal protein L29 [Parcubacteria group bacterium GW2011_GWA2_47_8]|nr:MAG: 50S ribosomal protein L29 [Parcubacteria group bacterium GW2011_GWA2_47_8]OHB20412.1 MAG: 50S ribosomal protein L29 [Parcubacteria group bacterium RIFCSPHIGHO2_01_FULL_47_10b]
MTSKELRKKPKEELQKALLEERQKLQDLHMKAAAAEDATLGTAPTIRRTIARILTIMSEQARDHGNKESTQ